MKPYMSDRKSTLSILRAAAAVSAFVAGCVIMSSNANAQVFPVSCFDTPAEMEVFVTGEKVGAEQIRTLWESIDSDCDRLPELMGSFIQQVGMLMELAAQEDIPRSVLCRVAGQASGVTVAWSRMLDSCEEVEESSQASVPASSKDICESSGFM